MKTGKVGRPKLPKGDAKQHIVPVRFSAKDLNALASAAKRKSLTLSQLIRDMCKTVNECWARVEYSKTHPVYCFRCDESHRFGECGDTQ